MRVAIELPSWTTFWRERGLHVWAIGLLAGLKSIQKLENVFGCAVCRHFQPPAILRDLEIALQEEGAIIGFCSD
ncbi:hypothetical protein TNCV_249791 [Trichonephila clavipes]|nr:hypothetical protein TNCV_249791 [Trichonephila clavipes]